MTEKFQYLKEWARRAQNDTWFRYEALPGGHCHFTFIRWFVQVNLKSRKGIVNRKPWPGAKFGLPSSKIKRWHWRY